MKHCAITILLLFSTLAASAQIPPATHIQILKAEDARRYDKTLEDLLRSQNAEVRERAALAAGRIGREEAIPILTTMLTTDSSDDVRAMAAFAIGEVESIRAADSILAALRAETRVSTSVQARLVEASGKIAAANPKDEKSKELGAAILKAVDFENAKRSAPSIEIIRLGMTAILRAKPPGGEETARKFLRYADPNVVADALNTLARLRAKGANSESRELVKTHADAVVRANAARVLGAAEDKDALEILLKAATEDKDSRVRVAAIRSLGSLKDAQAADKLLERGEILLDSYSKTKKPNFIPNEHSEFLEIATTLGRLLGNTRNERAVNLFRKFGKLDKGHSPEVYVARIRVAPGRGDDDKPELVHWRQYSTLAQVVGEFAAAEPLDDEGKRMKAEAPDVLRPLARAFAEADPVADAKTIMAGPDVLQAFARFKTADLAELLRTALLNKDVQIRAAAAGILADQPATKENVEALKSAFAKALLSDMAENDAQLSILDALYKLDKKESVGTLLSALSATDYLVRKKAFELLADKELQSDFPGIATSLENARKASKDQVLPFDPKSGTKLGQVLNTDADYRRALARKNGSVKAVLRSEKGTFTINLYPEDAPLTVDNFIKLARSKYFDGLEVHRVVPNFVMQDGDPRGDGNGGPGWSIRCEVNMLPYYRGAVGMALSGKDTGGSQWFVTHSPQPHLDGGYTVFGYVNETDMKVVDSIVRGDKILSVKIVEASLTQRSQRPQRKE